MKYRIEFEYGVKVQLYPMPYTAARWIRSSDPVAIEAILKDQAHIISRDQHDNPVILLDQIWRLKLLNERHPKITFATTSENLQDRIASE